MGTAIWDLAIDPVGVPNRLERLVGPAAIANELLY